MCGIVGVVQKFGGVDREAVRRMTEKIYHRGPDDSGFYFNSEGTAGLGFRRLSIIDLASGHQPMANEDGNVWVILNGEIYNFKDLRQRLVSRGHIFKTNSDTECVVHGYEEYGNDIFSHLNGMFAIAIWDERVGKLLLGRDRAGEKPLHYFYDGRTFVFGSEIKSLLVHPAISREINWGAVDEYFAYGYIAAPRSIYKKIVKLEPASYLIFQNSTINTAKYWEVDATRTFGGDYQEAKLELVRLMNEAVRIRMVSDVRLGAFLSGGIDSSTVVAFMARNSDQPIRTFSIGFNEGSFDERKYARMVASMYQTDHTELVLTSDLPVEMIERIVRNFDEPFGDSSALPTYSVSRLTRDHVTVSLSGDAGDELFAGYETYNSFLNKNAALSRIPVPARVLLSKVPLEFRFNTRLNKKLNFLKSVDDVSRFVTLFTQFSELERENFFSTDIGEELKRYRRDTKDVRALKFVNSFDFVNKMLYSDFSHYLPDDILVKVDRASMLSSLESRAPFLDHRMIEFAFSLPSAWKLRDQNTKAILKDALKGLLPDQVLHRGKMGFGVPLKHWFTNQLYDYCRTKLLGNTAAGVFNRAAIDSFLREHRAGRKDNSHKLWMLLVFVLWVENNRIKFS